MKAASIGIGAIVLAVVGLGIAPQSAMLATMAALGAAYLTVWWWNERA